jgi:lipopolysaccharide biosynthesis glycosyltransferase
MTIPIIFSANEYYIPYTAVAIQSIMEHANKEYCYSFYILYKDISDEFVHLLRKQISRYSNCLIAFIDVSDYISKYTFFVSRHITVETYFRLLIPYIFTDYDKVIYLDCDTLCLVDISELYAIELDDNLLSVVRDVGVAWYYSPIHSDYASRIYQILLNLQKPENYFNSGMAVINTDLFRKTFTKKYLFEFVSSHDFQLHDQDILNILCEGRARLLPFAWNFMKTPDTIYLPEYLKEQYAEAENNPKILHFKPWNSGNYSPYLPFSEYFWKYAVQTPFYDRIIFRMKEQKVLVPHSIQEQIFLNIKNRRGCGIRFIIKCFFIWIEGRIKKNSAKSFTCL